MKTRFITSVLITQIFFCQFVFAQQRGVRVVKTNLDGSKQEVQLYEGSFALVIGNSEYSQGWDRLSGVKSDVVAVRNILEKHGFKVEVGENLTSEQFERRVRKFINDYGYDRDNRLIIYYAGHGYTLNSAGDKRELGYIIPADTPSPDKDPRGFRQKAVSMYAIQTFAKDIQAKHALFVFDSCFSGKLFALRDTLKITPFIYDKVDNPVRQFITAGNETQKVPDESVFRKALVRGLEGDADRNKDGYIVGMELADYLKEAVTNYTNRRQTPQYGTINDINLDGGDFVFVPNIVNQSGQTVSLSEVKKKLQIISPSDNEKVEERPIVKGKVSDTSVEIFVLVHPVLTDEYWVQKAAKISKDGSWETVINIGNPGENDIGKHFEIMAVANPKKKIKKGDILVDWAEAKWSSQIIEVIRK